MKNFKNEDLMLDYIIDEVETQEELIVITTLDKIEEVLEYIEFDYKSLTKEIKENSYLYMLEKYTGANGIYLTVEAIEFDEEGNLENLIESDMVIVEDDFLEEEDFEEICTNELVIVNVDEDCGDDFSEECLGDCECCEGCNDEEVDWDIEIVNEYLQDKVDEFLEILAGNVDNDEFCFPCAIREMLEQVYCVAYEDGKTELALSLGDLLNDIVEE